MTEKKFEFNGKALFLTYKSHLTKNDLDKVIIPLKGIYDAVHETSDKEHKYDHTHVKLYFKKKTHIRNSRILDINDIHPHIKPITTSEHWENLSKYICKQNEPFHTMLNGIKYKEWGANIRQVIQGHKYWRDVINDDSIQKTVMRYTNWARECFNNKPKMNYTKDAVLRTWQKECITKIDEQNDREILWVYDKTGGKGKSYLTNYLIDNKNAFFCNNGKATDVAYAYEEQETVVIDLPRTTIDGDGKDWTPYRLMEMFKDGRIFSSKYQSCMKRFKSAKLVVFANYLPDTSKLSQDRWNIWDLNKKVPLRVPPIKAKPLRGNSVNEPKVVPEVLNIKGTSLSKNQKRRRRRKRKKNVVVPNEDSNSENDCCLRVNPSADNLERPRLQQLQNIIDNQLSSYNNVVNHHSYPCRDMTLSTPNPSSPVERRGTSPRPIVNDEKGRGDGISSLGDVKKKE